MLPQFKNSVFDLIEAATAQASRAPKWATIALVQTMASRSFDQLAVACLDARFLLARIAPLPAEV